MSFPFYQWEHLQRLQQLQNEASNIINDRISSGRQAGSNQPRISPPAPRFSNLNMPDPVRMRTPGNFIAPADTLALVEEMRNMFQSGTC